jgi:hypothetical protein
VNTEPTQWCCVPVIIDNETSELFKLTVPDDDPEQLMTFRVTQSTADLVPLDFDRYQPSLQRMVDDWRQQKARVMQMKPGKATQSSLAAGATATNSQRN